jgi:glycosyltransferase involved in cell wall biosynthesis
MTESLDSPIKSLVVTTMFGHGGVVTYWKDIINACAERATWLIFVNEVAGVDADPFKRANVKVTAGIEWANPFTSSRNLVRAVSEFQPHSLILNGTLAVLRVLPAIIYFRLFRPKIRIKCVFHNGAIYQHVLKDAINLVLVSGVGWLCHENLFVSRYVSKYWLCPGIVHSRPFTPRRRDSYVLPESPRVGFLGRISREKDPELFLKVMSRVREKLPVNVEIAGVGPMKDSLQAKYPWATWCGWVAPSEWLKGVDLLVTTSKTEGWPIGIGEALEAGVPVVGINVGGVGEVLAGVPSRWVQNTRDENLLSAGITLFLEHYSENSENYFKALQRPKETLEKWGLHVVW